MRVNDYPTGQILYAAQDIPNADVFGDDESRIFASVGTPCKFLYRDRKPRNRFLCVVFEGQPPYGIHDSYFTAQEPGAHG